MWAARIQLRGTDRVASRACGPRAARGPRAAVSLPPSPRGPRDTAGPWISPICGENDQNHNQQQKVWLNRDLENVQVRI